MSRNNFWYYDKTRWQTCYVEFYWNKRKWNEQNGSHKSNTLTCFTNTWNECLVPFKQQSLYSKTNLNTSQTFPMFLYFNNILWDSMYLISILTFFTAMLGSLFSQRKAKAERGGDQVSFPEVIIDFRSY